MMGSDSFLGKLSRLIPLRKRFCKHEVKTIVFHDVWFDFAIDNDDLEDFPTLAEVNYCTKCGKVLSTDFHEKTHGFFCHPDLSLISPPWEVREFKKMTGKTLEDVSLRHRYRKQVRD